MTGRQGLSPILYFPHGGGPLPLLGDEGHKNMVDFLRRITPELGKPSAIIVISAHWEENTVTVTSGAAPPLLYDYYGFPEEAYRLAYDAPGSPELAEEILRLLTAAGIACRPDDKRGFDHGMFVPLKLMYPGAGIPCVQVSLIRGLDPEAHILLGRALGVLRERKVLVLGSGFSFHNLRAFGLSGPAAPDAGNEAFQQWLIDICTNRDLPQAERESLLAAWDQAPSARYCHPREEHLLPLHVCAGMAGGPADLVFDGEVLGKRSISLLWS